MQSFNNFGCQDDEAFFSQDWDEICNEFDVGSDSMFEMAREVKEDEIHPYPPKFGSTAATRMSPTKLLELHAEHEILKSYAKSIEVAFNFQDRAKMNQTLDACCSKDMTLVVHYPRGNPVCFAYKQMNGRAGAADYLYNQFAAIPDALFLIHDTQVLTDDEGRTTVKCKYTINGTRLYTIQVEQQGCRIPDPPAMTQLYSAIKLIKSVAPDEEETYCAKGGHLTFKKHSDEPSKFDRYKEKASTMGLFVEFHNFTESSLLSRKKKSIEEREAKKRQNKRQRTNSPVSIINRDSSVDSILSGHSSDSCAGSTTDETDFDHIFDHNELLFSDHSRDKQTACDLAAQREAMRVAAITAEIASAYPLSDQIYGDSCNTKFTLSPLLAMPVPLDAHGVMKLYINTDKKVSLMEIMLSVKAL